MCSELRKKSKLQGRDQAPQLPAKISCFIDQALATRRFYLTDKPDRVILIGRDRLSRRAITS